MLIDEVKLPEDLSMQLSTVRKIPMSSSAETAAKIKEEIDPSFIGDGIEGYEAIDRKDASRNIWRIVSIVFASLLLISAIFIFGYFNNWFSFAGVDTISTSDVGGREVEITQFKDNVSRSVLLKAYDGSSLYFCGSYMVSDPNAIRYREGSWYVADNKADSSEFGDLEILTDKEKIEYLALVSENIKDASELSKMKQLIYLDLSGNPLSDISFLKYLEKLQILKLVDTKVSDFSVLNGLSDLKYLYISHDVLDKALEYIDTSRIDLVIKK